MKIKDLPKPKEGGTRIRLYLKKQPDTGIVGTMFSPYKWKDREEQVREEWRIPFLPEGWNKRLMQKHKLRLIERIEVAE